MATRWGRGWGTSTKHGKGEDIQIATNKSSHQAVTYGMGNIVGYTVITTYGVR